MWISITNWDKYNPRADVKHTTWFRLENTFWMDPTLTPLDGEGKLVWVVLLSLASQHQKGVFEVDSYFVSEIAKVTHDKLEAVLKHLQERGKIKIHASRPRHVRVTSTSRTRNAGVRIRTATERNVTGRNGTERDDSCAGHSATAESPSPPLTVEVELIAGPPSEPKPAKRAKKPPSESAPAGRVWSAYAEAYAFRYGNPPVRNAKVNGQCAQLVARLGADAAVEVVKFYLTHAGRYYVQTLHPLGACLKDAEGLHTQWQAGTRVTTAQAIEADRSQATGDQVRRLAAHLEAKFGADLSGATKGGSK